VEVNSIRKLLAIITDGVISLPYKTLHLSLSGKWNIVECTDSHCDVIILAKG
jgi:hypothetical protein